MIYYAVLCYTPCSYYDISHIWMLDYVIGSAPPLSSQRLWFGAASISISTPTTMKALQQEFEDDLNRYITEKRNIQQQLQQRLQLEQQDNDEEKNQHTTNNNSIIHDRNEQKMSANNNDIEASYSSMENEPEGALVLVGATFTFIICRQI